MICFILFCDEFGTCSSDAWRFSQQSNCFQIDAFDQKRWSDQGLSFSFGRLSPDTPTPYSGEQKVNHSSAAEQASESLNGHVKWSSSYIIGLVG